MQAFRTLMIGAMLSSIGAPQFPPSAIITTITSTHLFQSPPISVITVNTQNNTYYVTDTPDITQYAKDPGPVPSVTGPGTAPTFTRVTMIGDIVSVNGAPAKGTVVNEFTVLNLMPDASPGHAIGDVSAFAIGSVITMDILLSDGTRIGNITASGLNTSPPPGSGGYAVSGGTGSFLGATGEILQSKVPNIFGRAASVREDPSNRRINGGGTSHFVVHLIPLTSPEVLTNDHGVEIVHANDFRPVSRATPAHPGETLILFASGLGPTRPGVDPGVPFTADPVQVVNAPVEVLVNSHAAEVLYATGVAGTQGKYEVSFRVPADTVAGTAELNLTVAWISGRTVQLAVQ
jgi:hypothetical protein